MCDYCYDEPTDPKVDWTTPNIYGEYENEYGTMWLYQTGESVHVSDFRVKDEYQNQGHGRRMLQAVLDKCNEGELDAHLEVLSENARAIHLYESLGFVKTGELSHGYIFEMKWYCKRLVLV